MSNLTERGGDVSYYQASNQADPPTTPMDFQKAEGMGWKYTYIRSSHGLSKDPEYPRHYHCAEDTNLLRGNYHHFEEWYSGMQQAAFFLDLTKQTRGELPLAVGVEVKCKASEVWSFCQFVYDEAGHWPLLYTSPNAWNNYVSDNIFWTYKNKFIVCDLWQAQWPKAEYDNGKTVVALSPINPWAKKGKAPVMHQYSSKNGLGSVYGSHGSVNIDLDLADPTWLQQFSREEEEEPPLTWAQAIDEWARTLGYNGPHPEV